MAKRFSLMGYGAQSHWPNVRTVDTVDPAEVMRAADVMLEESPSLERVEVWAGEKIVHTHRRTLAI